MTRLDRRAFVAKGLLTLAAAASGWRATPALSLSEEDYFDGMAEDHGVLNRRINLTLIDPAFRRQLVAYPNGQLPGSIVIDTREHFLYVTRDDNSAIRYGVGVGREGFQWFGSASVQRKAIWPN
ncbi:L,D-transpeptidase [Chelatococcus sp. SYSU_G07232]|uniref:L,D-transpeptidase n=1 Tax=Chelatococcus albus TaxID=3047466 RepID=A0ABT7AIM4_9HYPH|nr:L,D-transpeptidase [Chelatococcus sp. SYSU_G07232]MDJ1159227.1 L,D-transpeptidase [Chelatococcus sp. SYSU_G07232]